MPPALPETVFREEGSGRELLRRSSLSRPEPGQHVTSEAGMFEVVAAFPDGGGWLAFCRPARAAAPDPPAYEEMLVPRRRTAAGCLGIAVWPLGLAVLLLKGPGRPLMSFAKACLAHAFRWPRKG